MKTTKVSKGLGDIKFYRQAVAMGSEGLRIINR
jgi:hypothetical protein